MRARAWAGARPLRAASAVLALTVSSRLGAQQPSEAAFLDSARAGTARYRDLPTAVADGYRRVGGELPSMGEHWLHTGRALADTLDPAAPPILIYIRVAGRPVLAGVAYTRFLSPDAPYPAFPVSAPGAWHDHNGTVGEEVLPLGHFAAARPTRGAARIAVMHAWVWVTNPDGVYASNNWGLPYVRVGLPPDAGPRGDDARALALVAGGDVYFLRSIAAAAAPDEAETARLRPVLAACGARATTIAGRLTATAVPAREGAAGGTEAPAAEMAALAALWAECWSDVAGALRPETNARLAPLRSALAVAGEAQHHHYPP